MENLAANIPLGTTFTGDNVESIVPGMQLISLDWSCHVTILSTERDENTVAYVSDQEEASVGCTTAKLTVIPARTQAQVMKRFPVVGHHVVETQPHLIRKRVAVVARVVCKTVPNRPFTTFVSMIECSDHAAKEHVGVQCTQASDTSWLKPYEGDGINMTQLYKEAESKGQYLELHCAVLQKGAVRLENTRQSRFNSMESSSKDDRRSRK